MTDMCVCVRARACALVSVLCDIVGFKGQALPIAKAVNAKFEEALATAGDQDFSAVLTVTKSK